VIGDGRRYTPSVKRRKPLLISVVCGALASAGVPGVGAAEITVADPGGEPVTWSSWVEEHAPVAVILWASWTPGARETIDRLPEMAAAARSRNLDLVVVSLQEDIDEARRILGSVKVTWLHDRYGNLLKHYRVVRIPALLVIDRNGEASARLDPIPESINAWSNE